MTSNSISTLDQWADFGIAEFERGRYTEAEKWFRAILRQNPNHFDGLQLLGLTLVRQGVFAEGIQSMALALQIKPQATHVLSNLAEAQRESGNLAGYVQSLIRLCALNPTAVDPRLRLVTAYATTGQTQQALTLALELFEQFPSNVDSATLLARLWRTLGRRDNAVLAYASALQLAPNDSALRFDLGDLFLVDDNAAAAEECFESAMATVEPWLRRGATLGLTTARLDQGRWTDWDRHVQELSTPIRPDERGLNPFLSLLIPLPAERAVAFTQAATREWIQADLQAQPRPLQPLPRWSDQRPLRVAYVSPDFRDHPVGRIVAPVIEALTRRGTTVICVHCAGHADPITERIRSAASVWLDAAGVDDAGLAAALQDQDVDLVVDLAGPTAGARPGIFRYQPGRARVSWLGYPGSAAHPDVPYVLTDQLSVPESLAALFGETVVRLPVPAMTMDGWMATDRTLARQHLGVGDSDIVIGSLAKWRKINPLMFWQWITALERVPHAVLVIRRPPGHGEDFVREALAERSMSTQRIRFVDATPDYPAYLARLSAFDLALDTYPYGSHSMTLDALRVGTPTLAVRGAVMQSRIGAAMMSAVGLETFVTDQIDQVSDRLVSLMGDAAALTSARSILSTKLPTQSMLQPDLFATYLDAAHRQILMHAAQSDTGRLIDVSLP